MQMTSWRREKACIIGEGRGSYNIYDRLEGKAVEEGVEPMGTEREVTRAPRPMRRGKRALPIYTRYKRG